MDLSARLDAIAERLSQLSLDGDVQHAIEAAAELVAKQKLSHQQQRAMKRAAKKHQNKKKVWVEVTGQPKKGRHGTYVGHASFFWKGDSSKTKHSQVITPGGPAKLSIKSQKLFVKPKGGEGYFYGAKPEDGGHKGGQVDEEKGSETRQEPKLDPHVDQDGDGVADAARVGVPAKSLAPPPSLPRLHGLNKTQADIENNFSSAVENDPDGMAKDYLSVVLKKASDGNPPTFVTDDVKFMHPDYHGGKVMELKDKEGRVKFDKGGKPIMVPDKETMDWRAKNNVCLHNASNAVAKRAFVKHLDDLAKLPEGDPKKSVLVTSGGCGCHAADTAIMMADGTIKMVQDIREGEKLMGPDSEPRTVLRTIRGHGPMYRVTPSKGDSFVVNDEHVLSLKTLRALGSQNRTRDVTVNLTVNEILARGTSFRASSYLYRTDIEFLARPVPLDPYFLGLWLGDGTSCRTDVTSADPEIAAYLEEFAKRFEMDGIHLMVIPKPDNASSIYAMRPIKAGSHNNRVLHLLEQVGVLNNKHMPDLYARNSRSVRLAVLAGLMDSDGYLSRGSCFDYISKERSLADGVVFIARSLGLAAYMTPCRKSSQTGFTGDYYRVCISGDLSIVPTLVLSKQAGPRTGIKDVLKVGYELEAVGPGEFFGFTLDRDNLYVMGDFTVTHNSGKGFAVKNGPGAVKNLKNVVGAIWDAAGEQNATENPWILDECKKRGIRPTFMFADADPERQWANPKLGVVQRAADPEGEGRMVDARLFADSYALGAKNFKAFHDKHKDDADFVFLNTWDMEQGRDKDGTPLTDKEGKPVMFPVIKQTDHVDDRSTSLDSDKLYSFATKVIQDKAPSEAIKEGATVGQKVWGPPPKDEGNKATASFNRSVVMISAAKGDALKKLRDSLAENFKENMKALDDFEHQQTRDTMEATKDVVLDKDKDGKLSRRKKDGKAVDAAAIMDAIVTVLEAKVNLPAKTLLALEEAAAIVNARVRRRRHRMLRYAQHAAGREKLDNHKPEGDVSNVTDRLTSLPVSIQNSIALNKKLGG